MSTAVVSRLLAFAAIGGRALAQFGDEFARVMGVYGDDIARSMGSADDLARFLETNGDDIAKLAGENGDEFLAALRSAAPALFQQATRLSSGLDDVMKGFLARTNKAEDLATYLRTHEQEILRDHGDVVYEVLRGSAPQIEARITTAAAEAAAPGAASVADDAAAAVVSTAEQAAGILNSPLTWKRVLQGHATMTGLGLAAYLGVHIYEHESGGALLDGAVRGAAAGIKELIHSGVISMENLEDYIDAAAYALDVATAFDKSAQNQEVRLAMDLSDTPTEDQIAHGKIAAAAWLLKPDNLAVLFTKHMIRAQVVDDIYPDRNEADRYLAECLIDDILDGTEVLALEGHQVSREDVRKALEEALKSGTLSTVIPRGGRLENGFRQIWPELFAAPAAEERPDDALDYPQIQSLTGASLTAKFNEVVQENNLHWYSSFSMFLATVLDAVGLDSIADQFKRAVVVDATISRYGDRFGILRDPGTDPQPAPAPSPVAGPS